MRADGGLAEPAVNRQRAAEEQQLRTQRLLAPTADNHVALPQRAVEVALQPRLYRHVACRVECDQVDEIAPASISGGIGAEDQLGRDLAHPFELGETRKHIAVKRELGWLRCKQGRRDIGQRAGRNDQHVGAQPRKSNRHARFDASHQHCAGQKRPAANGHGRDQQQGARLASSEILQRQAAQEEPKMGPVRHAPSCESRIMQR